MLVEFDIIKIF